MSVRKNILILAAFVILAFSSCIGVNADIVLNKDNSGTLTLEYRFPLYLDSLGKLDGNEHEPPVAVGEEDFTRTTKRIPGLKMLSYQAKNSGSDRLMIVKMEFADMDALLKFLDASGQKAVYVRQNASHKLTLNLSEGGAGGSPELESLFSSVAKGYFFNISLTVPDSGTLTAPDLADASYTKKGKKLSSSIPTGDILKSRDKIDLEFNW